LTDPLVDAFAAIELLAALAHIGIVDDVLADQTNAVISDWFLHGILI